MEERNIALTKEGYEKLDEELKYLKGPKKNWKLWGWKRLH